MKKQVLYNYLKDLCWKCAVRLYYKVDVLRLAYTLDTYTRKFNRFLEYDEIAKHDLNMGNDVWFEGYKHYRKHFHLDRFAWKEDMSHVAGKIVSDFLYDELTTLSYMGFDVSGTYEIGNEMVVA